MKHRFSIIATLLFLVACTPPGPVPQEPRKALPKPAPILSEPMASVPEHGEIPQGTPQIKVGILLPLSGESMSVGTAMLDAATLALYDTYLKTPSNEIKAQIVLLPKDAGNTPAESAKAAQQAIDQGATFIIGPLFSQSVSLVAPILQPKNISMITFSNNQAVAAKNIYTFGFLPEQQVERIAEYAFLNKLTRVALLVPNDSYGEKVHDTLTDIYEHKGGVVAPTELYAPSPSNIDAAVSRLVGFYNNTPEDRRFQAIFIADGGYQLKNILNSLKRTNIDLKKIKLLGTGLWDDVELAKLPDMQGAWFPSSPPELYQAFEKRFVASYAYKPARLAGLAYDAVTFTAQLAMSGSDGLNTAALTNPKGFTGSADGLMRLLENGTSERKLAIMEVTANGLKVIDHAPKMFTEKEMLKK